MQTSLKNNRGSALALMMASLPLIVGLLILVYSVVSFTQIDLKLQYICHNEGLAGQEKVAPLLQSLLGMNKKAKELQRSLKAAEKAALSGEPHAVAALAALRVTVAIFMVRQEQLIMQSNLAMVKASQAGQQKLRAEGQFKELLLFSGHLTVPLKLPRLLAVRPDGPDLPPTYSPVFNFSSAQALEQSWQYDLRIIKPLQPFLNGDVKFKKSCGVTLKKDNDRWVPQIKKDKS